MNATRQLPAVPDFATTLVSAHFYPTRSVVVSAAPCSLVSRASAAPALPSASSSAPAERTFASSSNQPTCPATPGFNAPDIEETRS